MPDVVVVGGGIIGAACAHELARRGVGVTLLERDELATGASGRNHGLLLVPTDPLLVPMYRVSLETYRAMEPEAPVPLRLDEERLGFLLVAGDDELERAGSKAEAEAVAANGVAVEHVDADRLRSIEPVLAPEMTEGWLLDDGYRVDPGALTVSLALLATDLGAEIRTHLTVRSLIVQGDHVRGVVTDDGRIEADTVVLAAGPASAALLRVDIGNIPVRGSRGWLVNLLPKEPVLQHLIELGGWHGLPEQNEMPPVTARDVVEGGWPGAMVGTLIQPNADGTVLIGGSRQDVLAAEPEDPNVPAQLLRSATRVVPALAEADVLGARWGVRPMTPDGRPLIGALRDGLIVAAGHGSQGIILGAGTARLVAAAVTGDDPAFDPSPFDPSRI
ncbi:MAG TPA: FAD-binding oxidoreductase [Actinomycetota bacterium]|nr:FAD-binding oxidoreductase [Actinomycetota bacterium]